MASFGLSGRQALFVAGLALGKSQAESARLAGVSERTGRRWCASPVVRAELRKVQADAMAQAAHLAATMASEALRVLGDVLDDGQAPASVRVVACRVVLENSRALHEQFGLAERLADVERVLSEQDKR